MYIPLGKLSALNVNEYSPASLNPYSSIFTSSTNEFVTTNLTFPSSFSLYFTVIAGLNGFG